MGATVLGQLLPIGANIDADISEAQFQAQMGSGWVLKDGRSVVGSAYHALTGNTNIPDARGLFPRAKNNGRADGKQNPDGDLALGTYTADKFASHVHQETYVNSAAGGVATPATFRPTLGGGGSGSYNTISSTTIGSTISPTPTALETLSTGANETAPKSLTVNIFIRIN